MDKLSNSDFNEILKVLKKADTVFKDFDKAGKSIDKAIKLDKSVVGANSFFTSIPFIAEKIQFFFENKCKLTKIFYIVFP